MEQQRITTINGVDIVTVEQNGEIFVPIKPICEVVTVNYTSQVEKLQSDETFATSTVPLRGIVAADGKEREMLCLPLWLVYLWLGTINPKYVSDEARPKVIAYRLECARALYEHFTGSMRRTIETNNAEIDLLRQINSAITDEKEAKGRRKKAEEALGKLRSERLNTQPSLF
ncbi:MAG: phage antirepressor N-terminal domain-containing protein [Muribaculaceae bacterium]|nr:phage antirepressor N-terminal domain-containing protein [Muribaculaceae bacterium]